MIEVAAPRACARAQRGYNLVELTVTLLVALVLALIGLPSFRNMMQSNRMTGHISDFVAALSRARSEAITRGHPATVCMSANGSSCNGTNWEDGWIVFSDQDGDGVPDLGSGSCAAGEDCIVRVRPALEAGTTLRSGRTRVTYRADGLAVGFNGTWTFCDARGAADARAVIVSNTGRPRTASGSSCP